MLHASLTALLEALAAIEGQTARLDEQLKELGRCSPPDVESGTRSLGQCTTTRIAVTLMIARFAPSPSSSWRAAMRRWELDCSAPPGKSPVLALPSLRWAGNDHNSSDIDRQVECWLSHLMSVLGGPPDRGVGLHSGERDGAPLSLRGHKRAPDHGQETIGALELRP